MALTTTPTPSPAILDIMHGETHCIGHAVQEVDGTYYFLPRSTGSGLWASYTLRQIADLLDGLNAPYEKELAAYFDSLPEEISREAQGDSLPF
jgi:hypothetical protein